MIFAESQKQKANHYQQNNYFPEYYHFFKEKFSDIKNSCNLHQNFKRNTI